MKGGYILFCVELIASFILAFLLNTFSFDYDLMTVFGLINLIISILTLIVGLVIYVSGDKKTGNHLYLAGGLLLLVGVGTCSAFPLRLNAPSYG